MLMPIVTCSPGGDNQRRTYTANLKRWTVHGYGRDADVRVVGLKSVSVTKVLFPITSCSEIDARFIKNQTVGQIAGSH